MTTCTVVFAGNGTIGSTGNPGGTIFILPWMSLIDLLALFSLL